MLEGGASSSGGGKGGLRDALGAFYRFTRPHTIRGTILASAMGVLRCLIEHPKAFTLEPIPRALLVCMEGGGGGLLLGLGSLAAETIRVVGPTTPKINRPTATGAAGASVRERVHRGHQPDL